MSMSAEGRELRLLATQGNVGGLPEPERKVVILRLGWHGEEPRTQQEVADHLGVSQPYVSILERRAKHRLAKTADS